MQVLVFSCVDCPYSSLYLCLNFSSKILNFKNIFGRFFYTSRVFEKKDNSNYISSKVFFFRALPERPMQGVAGLHPSLIKKNRKFAPTLSILNTATLYMLSKISSVFNVTFKIQAYEGGRSVLKHKEVIFIQLHYKYTASNQVIKLHVGYLYNDHLSCQLY